MAESLEARIQAIDEFIQHNVENRVRAEDVITAIDENGVRTLRSKVVELTSQNANGLDSALREARKAPGAEIVFDLQKTEYVDCIALAALVGAAKALQKGGKQLTLQNAGSQLLDTLRATHLDRIFNFVPAIN